MPLSFPRGAGWRDFRRFYEAGVDAGRRTGVLPHAPAVLRALLLLTVCLPVFAGAAESCPWLNAATAGGILGEPVTGLKVTHLSSVDDVTCGYTSIKGSLRIEVETMAAPSREFASYLAHCHSPAASLKAIGNEAVACTDNKPGETAEQVISRVRNRALVVRISANGTTHSDSLLEKARRAAEQVAGILF